MSSEIRDRFLIALAKFFGENPEQADPLGSVRICDAWALDETLNSILNPEGQVNLGLEKFNRLMVQCGRRMASAEFHDYFFNGVATIEQVEDAVERFRQKALWLFGNFRYAYRSLATSDSETFRKQIGRTERISADVFEERDEFSEIEPIPVEDLHLLGYISGQTVDDLDFCSETIEVLRKDTASLTLILAALGAEKQQKISSILTKHNLSFPSLGTEGLDEASLAELSNSLSVLLEPLKVRAEKAMEIGRRNTHRYLSLPHLDVYVATSMGNEADFKEQHEFIQEIFENPLVKPLNLRFFDPTLSYVDDRVTKGVVECLMLRRARLTIYNAGATDTLGKDSELAATLAQGKPAIVYVPEGAAYDTRAKKFKEDHPLGLQIDIRTGVAHGILVVRSVAECAEMLRKVLLRELEFDIIHQSGNHLLRERKTGSILRVASDDKHLTHAFWTYFHGPREH